MAVGLALPAHAQSASQTLTGPDATPNLLSAGGASGATARPQGLRAWKSDLKDRTGLDFGLDYNLLG